MEKHATRPWGSKSESKTNFGAVAPIHHGSAAFDGLPETFINALRTLFDVMDDEGTGFVRLTDIEKRWKDDCDSIAPKGVVECLKKVAPANGLLSFERFCAGLKICLLRNRAQQAPKTAAIPHVRPPSAPVLDLDRDESPTPGQMSGNRDMMGRSRKSGGKIVNMATVRPNNVANPTGDYGHYQQLRSAVSMPHLNDDQDLQGAGGNSYPDADESGELEPTMTRPKQTAEPQAPKGPTAVPLGVLGPPKPPRVNMGDGKSAAKSEIRAALHCWHMGLLHSDSESVKSGSDFELSAIAESATRKDAAREMRLSANSVSLNNLSWDADGNVQITSARGQSSTIVSYMQAGLEAASPVRRSTNRRREPRRHTLQSGIDYNMLKRLKQVEQEREMIVTGLQTLEKAKDWYLGQLALVEEKMRDVGRNGQFWEHSSEAYQERMNFQRARITEVNQHLLALIESSEKGFPLHMNLALRLPNDPMGGSQNALGPAHNQLQINNRSILRLKDQNRQLTEEVGKKTERVTALEREKAVLIRELFQARSVLRSGAVTPSPVSSSAIGYHSQQHRPMPMPMQAQPQAVLHQGTHGASTSNRNTPTAMLGTQNPPSGVVKGSGHPHRRATDESAFL